MYHRSNAIFSSHKFKIQSSQTAVKAYCRWHHPNDFLFSTHQMQVFPSKVADAPGPGKKRESILFNNHFNATRYQPSSRVTFRGEAIYIYEHGASQVQMRISNQQPQPRDDNTSVSLSEDEEIEFDTPRKTKDLYYPPLKIETKDVQHELAYRWIYTIVALFCMATVSCTIRLLHQAHIQRHLISIFLSSCWNSSFPLAFWCSCSSLWISLQIAASVA